MAEDIATEYEKLLQFVYLAPVGLIQLRPDGEIVLINPLSAQLLMPLSRGGFLLNFFDAIEPYAPEIRNLAEAFAPAHGTICDAFRIQISAGVPGKEDPKILSVTLIKLDHERLMVAISDVTMVAKRERQLKQSEAWFNAILAGVTDYALMSLDEGGNIEAWNASIERVTQYDAAAVAGKPFSMFYPADTINADRARDHLRDAHANGWAFVEGWCRKADGSQFWSSSLIAPLDEARDQSEPPDSTIPGQGGYALIIRDISDQRQSASSLMKAVMSDYLTGVSNRRAFFETAEIEIQRWRRAPRPLSLLAIDADHFKVINDTYGHAAGDVVLKQMASTLLETVRRMDTVARIGGEEFAVLLPSTDLEAAKVLAERIRHVVAMQPVEVDGVQIRYTVSIGVSTMFDSVTGVDCLLKQADKALYVAKQSGRNLVTVFAGDDERADFPPGETTALPATLPYS